MLIEIWKWQMEFEWASQINALSWVSIQVNRWKVLRETLAFPKCLKTFPTQNEEKKNIRGIFPTFIKLIAMMFHLKWIYLFICFFFSVCFVSCCFVRNFRIEANEVCRMKTCNDTVIRCKMNEQNFSILIDHGEKWCIELNKIATANCSRILYKRIFGIANDFNVQWH